MTSMMIAPKPMHPAAMPAPDAPIGKAVKDPVGPPQVSSSHQIAVRPSPSSEVGPGPQQATGLRVVGNKPLQGAAEIWTGRNAKGLYAYLVTRTVSVPLGRITQQALSLAQQGSTPLNRSEDFLGLARSLMSDPGISGRNYAEGNVEIVADLPATRAELTANYGAGRVPTFNMRLHEVMREAGLAPDPRDGSTYTLPATKLGGQIAARIFFGERQGQAGVLNGMADANQLFPGAPKDFIDGFNRSKVGFIALRTVSGIQQAITALGTFGAAKVWGAKIQGRPVSLNSTLYVPGTGPVSRLTSALLNRLPSPLGPATVPNKGRPEALIPGAQKNPTPSANPIPTNYSVPKPTGGGGSVSRPSPGTAKAANSPYLARNPGGLGTGQTNGQSRASKPNDQSPAPLPATFKRRELAQIGGVKASHVPDGGNPTTTYHQATAQTRQHNSIRGFDVSLVYPVKHQGALSLHVIKNISPSEARALLTQLEKGGTLALKPETVFLQNGIGGRSSDGSLVTPEQDLQRREADIFFGKLAPQQVTDTAQANTQTVNGKRGTALNPIQWNEVSRLYTQANDPQRGTVSLALLRLHTLQGPHGQKREMPLLETWADLTPAEARALLNQAAGFNDKGQQVYRPTLMHPPGVSGKDAITATLKANGLSPEGLSQRERVISRSQEQQRQKQFQVDQAKQQAAQVATSQLQQQPQQGPAGTPWTPRMADAGRNVLPLSATQQKEIEAGAYNLANPDRAGAKATQEKTQALHTQLQQALVQRVTQSLAPPNTLAPDLSGWSFKQMAPGASTELKFGGGSLWLPKQEITLVKPGETPRVFQATPVVEPATSGRPTSIGFQISETSKLSSLADLRKTQERQLKEQQSLQAGSWVPTQQPQQGPGLPPNSAIVRWANDYPGSQLVEVLRSNPDIVSDARRLEQQGWSFDWTPRVQQQTGVRPQSAQINPERKTVTIDGGMALPQTWPKALEIALRDGIRQAQTANNGVENDVSWLALQRGPLDQTTITTSSLARFGPDSENRVLFGAPIQAELKAAAQQAWVGQRRPDVAFDLPNTTVSKLDSVATAVRGQDGAIPDYLIRMRDSVSGDQYYRATAERVSSRTDAQDRSTITWRLEASTSRGEVGVPTTSFATGGPAATPQRSPFDEDTITYRSNLDLSGLTGALRAGLEREFPWRAGQIAEATIEPLPGSRERTVPADSVFGNWGIGIDQSAGAPNRSTVELPAVMWRLSMTDTGMRHDYLVRVKSYDHSGGRIAFEVTPDPESRQRQMPLSPAGTTPVTGQTLGSNQQYIAEASRAFLRDFGQLTTALSSLDPKIRLEFLKSGEVGRWLEKAASNPVLNTVPYIVTPDSIEAIVQKEAAGGKRVLVLYSGNATADLSSFADGRVPNVTLEPVPATSDGAALQAVLRRSDIDTFDKVIALGGGTAKDLAAMAVSVGTNYDALHKPSQAAVREELQRLKIDLPPEGQPGAMKQGVELIVIPTQLAQTGNTTPFAVLKTLVDGLIMLTPFPARTYITPKLTATAERWTPEKLRHSLFAGAADYSAALSYSAAKAAQEGIPIREAIKKYAPEAARVYDWFVENLPLAQNSFNAEAAMILAYAFQEYGTNHQPLLADEHSFFDIVDKLRPQGRGPWPSHGEWVAVGTVLNLYVYGQQTGDFSLYEKVRNDYLRLGLPVDLAGLEGKGATSDHLIRALGTLRTSDYSNSPRPPLLRDYLKTNDPRQLINDALRNR